jgi:hypothetical protein
VSSVAARLTAEIVSEDERVAIDNLSARTALIQLSTGNSLFFIRSLCTNVEVVEVRLLVIPLQKDAHSRSVHPDDNTRKKDKLQNNSNSSDGRIYTVNIVTQGVHDRFHSWQRKSCNSIQCVAFGAVIDADLHCNDHSHCCSHAEEIFDESDPKLPRRMVS